MTARTITLSAGTRRRKASVSRRSIVAMLMVPVVEKARCLDREADNALAWGQHRRAENLSRLAAELRDGAR